MKKNKSKGRAIADRMREFESDMLSLMTLVNKHVIIYNESGSKPGIDTRLFPELRLLRNAVKMSVNEIYDLESINPFRNGYLIPIDLVRDAKKGIFRTPDDKNATFPDIWFLEYKNDRLEITPIDFKLNLSSRFLNMEQISKTRVYEIIRDYDYTRKAIDEIILDITRRENLQKSLPILINEGTFLAKNTNIGYKRTSTIKPGLWGKEKGETIINLTNSGVRISNNLNNESCVRIINQTDSIFQYSIISPDQYKEEYRNIISSLQRKGLFHTKVTIISEIAVNPPELRFIYEPESGIVEHDEPRIKNLEKEIEYLKSKFRDGFDFESEEKQDVTFVEQVKYAYNQTRENISKLEHLIKKTEAQIRRTGRNISRYQRNIKEIISEEYQRAQDFIEVTYTHQEKSKKILFEIINDPHKKKKDIYQEMRMMDEKKLIDNLGIYLRGAYNNYIRAVQTLKRRKHPKAKVSREPEWAEKLKDAIKEKEDILYFTKKEKYDILYKALGLQNNAYTESNYSALREWINNALDIVDNINKGIDLDNQYHRLNDIVLAKYWNRNRREIDILNLVVAGKTAEKKKRVRKLQGLKREKLIEEINDDIYSMAVKYINALNMTTNKNDPIEQIYENLSWAKDARRFVKELSLTNDEEENREIRKKASKICSLIGINTNGNDYETLNEYLRWLKQGLNLLYDVEKKRYPIEKGINMELEKEISDSKYKSMLEKKLKNLIDLEGKYYTFLESLSRNEDSIIIPEVPPDMKIDASRILTNMLVQYNDELKRLKENQKRLQSLSRSLRMVGIPNYNNIGFSLPETSGSEIIYFDISTRGDLLTKRNPQILKIIRIPATEVSYTPEYQSRL